MAQSLLPNFSLLVHGEIKLHTKQEYYADHELVIIVVVVVEMSLSQDSVDAC